LPQTTPVTITNHFNNGDTAWAALDLNNFNNLFTQFNYMKCHRPEEYKCMRTTLLMNWCVICFCVINNDTNKLVRVALDNANAHTTGHTADAASTSTLAISAPAPGYDTVKDKHSPSFPLFTAPALLPSFTAPSSFPTPALIPMFAVLAADPFNYLLPEEILYPPNASYMPVDAVSAELVNMLLVNPNDTAMHATNNLFGTVPNEDNQHHISTNFMDVPLQIDMSSEVLPNCNNTNPSTTCVNLAASDTSDVDSLNYGDVDGVTIVRLDCYLLQTGHCLLHFGLVTCMYCRVGFLPPDLSPNCNS
jgi:hypothetical protein